MKKKGRVGAVIVTAFLILAACQDESGEDIAGNGPKEETGKSSESAQMNNSRSGELGEGLREAENPTYPVGSSVIISAEHTNGTEAVEGTVAGAYDTTAYIVSYEPTNGGEPVEDYKWIIQEEIEEAGPDLFARGEQVVLNASHMAGMHGASAYIEAVEETTVYMVDYVLATGEKVTNDKWVVEKELLTNN